MEKGAELVVWTSFRVMEMDLFHFLFTMIEVIASQVRVTLRNRVEFEND